MLQPSGRQFKTSICVEYWRGCTEINIRDGPHPVTSSSSNCLRVQRRLQDDNVEKVQPLLPRVYQRLHTETRPALGAATNVVRGHTNCCSHEGPMQSAVVVSARTAAMFQNHASLTTTRCTAHGNTPLLHSQCIVYKRVSLFDRHIAAADGQCTQPSQSQKWTIRTKCVDSGVLLFHAKVVESEIGSESHSSGF